MSLPEDVARALATAEKTDVWKVVIKLLDASIYSESLQAVAKEQRGEDRAWHCGRVDALMAFKDVLTETQSEAAKQNGHYSSENGSSTT